jgi:hypothetical protein
VIRWGLTALVVSCGLAAAGRARADIVFIEAEGRAISTRDVSITSPFLVKDDAAASQGRYLTVASGFNSQAAPPTFEGVASYHFNVGTPGAYRIWARVIAPTRSDDSFWVRMEKRDNPASVLVRWNDIEPGSNWHWALVVPDGSTVPAEFNLEAGDHQLEVSYREDGAKVDVFVVTNDLTFNPKAPPGTAPAVSGDSGTSLASMIAVGSRSGMKLMWSEVPGARSYTVRRITFDPVTGDEVKTPFRTGLANHAFSSTSASCFDVIAIFDDGTFREPPFGECAGLQYQQTFLDTASLSFTPPMELINDSEGGAAPGTPDSLNAPPAHGRIRFDFEVGGAAKLQLWFVAIAPDKDHDSFWARMDDGAWIKWNNIKPGCGRVSNSNAGGAPVTFSVAGGSHRFELANRETGTRIDSIFFITDDLNATASICDD